MIPYRLEQAVRELTHSGSLTGVRHHQIRLGQVSTAQDEALDPWLQYLFLLWSLSCTVFEEGGGLGVYMGYRLVVQNLSRWSMECREKARAASDQSVCL